MNKFKFHLDDIILKSTFKVFNSKSENYNSFIDSFGNIIPCESHHHVEMALKILEDIDISRKNEIESRKDSIIMDKANIELLSFMKSEIEKHGSVTIRRDQFPKHCLFFDLINRTVNDLDSVEYQLKNHYGFIDNHERTIKRLEGKSEIKDFEKANKNKGYDAAEYLLINHGYLAVEDGYLLYDCRNKHTYAQAEVVNCERDVDADDYNIRHIFIKKSKEQLESELNNLRSKLISQKSYYARSENRFHCPGGWPRASYLRWRNECLRLGINVD